MTNKDTVSKFMNDDKFQESLELAMGLNMKNIIKILEEKYPISLSRVDKWNYENVVKEKQKLIKEYKLIR